MLGGGTVTITSQVQTVREVTSALRQARPDLVARLNDSIFNVAINDEMLVHDADNHPVRDGDVVEIVPAISGGERPLTTMTRRKRRPRN
jgi:molybdopterin converting factor small subunit